MGILVDVEVRDRGGPCRCRLYSCPVNGNAQLMQWDVTYKPVEKALSNTFIDMSTQTQNHTVMNSLIIPLSASSCLWVAG